MTHSRTFKEVLPARVLSLTIIPWWHSSRWLGTSEHVWACVTGWKVLPEVRGVQMVSPLVSHICRKCHKSESLCPFLTRVAIYMDFEILNYLDLRFGTNKCFHFQEKISFRYFGVYDSTSWLRARGEKAAGRRLWRIFSVQAHGAHTCRSALHPFTWGRGGFFVLCLGHRAHTCTLSLGAFHTDDLDSWVIELMGVQEEQPHGPLWILHVTMSYFQNHGAHTCSHAPFYIGLFYPEIPYLA